MLWPVSVGLGIVPLHRDPLSGQWGASPQTSRAGNLASNNGHGWVFVRVTACLRVPVLWNTRLQETLWLSSAPQGGGEHCYAAPLSSLILSISTFSCCFSPLPSPLYLLTGMILYTNRLCWIYQQLSCKQPSYFDVPLDHWILALSFLQWSDFKKWEAGVIIHSAAAQYGCIVNTYFSLYEHLLLCAFLWDL